MLFYILDNLCTSFKIGTFLSGQHSSARGTSYYAANRYSETRLLIPSPLNKGCNLTVKNLTRARYSPISSAFNLFLFKRAFDNNVSSPPISQQLAAPAHLSKINYSLCIKIPTRFSRLSFNSMPNTFQLLEIATYSFILIYLAVSHVDKRALFDT